MRLCREAVAHTHGQEEACNRDDSTGRRGACSSLKQLRARIAKRRRQEMRLTITPPRCGGCWSGVARRRGAGWHPATTKGGLSLWSALCIVSWLPSSILLSARNRNAGMSADGTRARENTIFIREMFFCASRLGSGSLRHRAFSPHRKRGPARRMRRLANRAGSAAARTEVGSDPAAR